MLEVLDIWIYQKLYLFSFCTWKIITSLPFSNSRKYIFKIVKFWFGYYCNVVSQNLCLLLSVNIKFVCRFPRAKQIGITPNVLLYQTNLPSNFNILVKNTVVIANNSKSCFYICDSRYLNDNTSVDPISVKLRNTCPKLYRSEDAACTKVRSGFTFHSFLFKRII